MRFDAATAIFVTVCLVAAVGSQLQAKILLDLFDTPLLTAWIVAVFLLVVGVAQWLCNCRDEPAAEMKRQSVSRLLLVVLHMADIVAFFIALNYCSVPLVAGMQVTTKNLNYNEPNNIIRK
jgi:SNF family Na+-dependent transporter